MKRILYLILAAGCAVSMASSTHAAAIEVGALDYAGTGCPSGTASITDTATFAIAFKQFTARNARKNCAITLPIKVAKGYQVSTPNLAIKGYVATNTTGSLSVDTFFAGQSTTAITHNIQGEREFVESFNNATNPNWSKCGDSVNLRINVAMIGHGSGEATIDTVNFANEDLLSALNYRTCQP
jgi:hypothetical protein